MSQGIHTRPRRFVVAAVVFFATLLGLLVSASPASAHDRLLGSDPAADSTVEQLPASLTLTFNAVVAADPGASEIQVTDAAGVQLADGAPVPDGPLVSQALAAPTTAGAVTVLWKVVSSDGHPISGEFAFTVASVPEPTPTETEPETSAPTAEPSATAEPIAPIGTETPEGTAPDNASDSSDVVPWIIGGVLAVLVVGATAYLIVSRARRRKGTSQTPPADSDTPSER